jgi:hypothetical protein
MRELFVDELQQCSHRTLLARFAECFNNHASMHASSKQAYAVTVALDLMHAIAALTVAFAHWPGIACFVHR